MNGIIIINKQKEYTSNDVVRKAKKFLKEKIGHTGTLDPNATGVLPILVGKGTQISKYLINHDKTYIATIKLGKKTDTADVEGNVILEKDVNLVGYEDEKIIEILNSFKGKSNQIPPMYSAIKVNGKKLYEYARAGKNIEVAMREIEIYDIDLINVDRNINEIIFKVSCSKGTYIRTLCEAISEKLNTCGYMKELCRTRVRKFLYRK